MTKANTIAIPVGFNPADPASVAAAFALLSTDGTDAFAVTQGNVNLVGPTLTADILSVASGALVLVTDYEYALVLPAETFSLATGGVVVEFAGGAVPAAVVTLAGLAPIVSTGASVAVPAAVVQVDAMVPSVASDGVIVVVPAAGVAVAGVVPELVGTDRTEVLVPAAAVSVAGQAPTVAVGTPPAPAGDEELAFWGWQEPGVLLFGETAVAAEEDRGLWVGWDWQSEN